ncbi:MAG TPA: hypothetical protein VGN20_02385 [Mucilaginibacter sp.]|jgi:hypothetical protein
MKNIFLTFAVLLFALPGFSQLAKPVQIDSLVTVSLPPGYQKKDTLGQQIYSVNGLYGSMIVIVEPNAKNNAPLKKENDLNKVLKKYVKGIQDQSEGGVAENVRDTTIGTLKAKTFTLKNDEGASGILLRKFILLYTNEVTYTFQYVYPDNRKDLVKAEMKAYIASIKLSPELQRTDQYLSNAKGLSTSVMIGIGGGSLVIILIVVFVIRRKKRLVMN